MDFDSLKKPTALSPMTPKRFTPEPLVTDPAMFYPKPSSERAQDVSHILASTFRDLYTRDVLGKDIVQNLMKSSDGSNEFHKRCMRELKLVHEEHKHRLNEYTMLEQHIIQARARTVAADEQALVHISSESGPQKYKELGLPPVKSNFKWCLDEEMLRKHNLIVPSDLMPKTQALVDGPKAAQPPRFAVPTLSSSMHIYKGPIDYGYEVIEENVEEERFPYPPDDVTVATLSTNSEEIASISPRISIKPAKKPEANSNKWQENMSHDQRMMDRAYLARMEQRHNFLKNPRYLPLSMPKASKLLIQEQSKQAIEEGGRVIIKDVTSDDTVQVFIPKPEVVLFSEWSVGRVYEAVLELKNISSVSRQLRVIPPTTSFFSIGLGKYPGTHGLVAPGLSAQFNVRFMPDSLSDYEDYIAVVSQAEQPLLVSLKAKRNPPKLTMPSHLHCGHCLVGGTKVVEMTVKNKGGSGRFCILKKTSWPAANFKTVVSPGPLDLGEFIIHPAVFELLAGQTMVLRLVFSPGAAERYSEELVMLCDNCQIQRLTIDGEGQSAAVELLSVSDGGEDEPRLGEVTDTTADHLIRFPPLNPHSFYTRQVLIHNSIFDSVYVRPNNVELELSSHGLSNFAISRTLNRVSYQRNVEMPFTWHVLKPNFQTSLRPDEPIMTDHFEFYPENSPAFFIEPQHGILQPNGIHEFVLTFAPHVVENYHNVLHLVLSNIPESNNQDSKQKQKESPVNNTQATTIVEGVGRKSPVSSSSGVLQSPAKMDSKSKPANSQNNTAALNSKSGAGNLKEVIALEIELKGESIPYSVLIHPPAIIVPGTVLEGTTVKRPFKMANYSLAPVQYEWSSETQPNIIQVEPQIGVIDPGDYAQLEVSISASKAGALSTNLQCKVEHLDELLNLKVQANIEGPRVIIENTLIDFGLVRLGEAVSNKVQIRNTTQLPASWNLDVWDYLEDRSELKITPSVGELSPLGQTDILITYTPKKTQLMSAVLDLRVKDGNSSQLSLTADVQTPQACFLNCEVVCKDSYLSVPQEQKAILLNQTSLTAKFHFGQVMGKQKGHCDLTVHPLSGVLAPREELPIMITFACHEVCEISSLVVPCYIEGMDKPIALGIYANVKPLAVAYSTPDSNCDELKVLYDDPVKLGSVVTKKIVLQNQTAIASHWSISVHHYGCKPPAPPGVKSDFKSANTRRAMLGRTPNLADPMAKSKKQSHRDHCNLMLSSGLGAAFVIKPPQGYLHPYQTQSIEVEAYSNMWGTYNDIINCNIDGLPVKQIPVEMNVVGCPLSFQIVSGEQDKLAVVRFGTHINNGPPVLRKLRVNNSSPMDIRVDWRVFNKPEPDDEKLLDLNVWYGHPFPKKDENGLEVVPAYNEDGSAISSDRSSHLEETPRSESSGVLTSNESSPRDGQPKVVSVRLEPHHGQLSNVPYIIRPNQSIVPAHGYVDMNAIFTPVLGDKRSMQAKEWISFVHGFMTLDHLELKHVQDLLTRMDGYSVSPLKVQLTALVRTGSLRVETEDTDEEGVEGVIFKVAMSDMLILKSKLASEAVQYKSCTLINDTEMPMDFKLAVSRPFFISSMVPTEGKDGRITKKEIRLEASARNRLGPQESLRVKFGFKLSSATLETLKSLRDDNIIPGAELIRMSSSGLENIIFQNRLEVSFSNGTKQSLPLMSTVSIPHFALSETAFNFGTCFVGKERCLQFKLANIGEAHSLWNAFSRMGDNSKNAQCFRVEPSNGFLEGYTSNVAKNKMVVCEGECMATFNISGVLGEIPQQIFLRGIGSYDGKYALE